MQMIPPEKDRFGVFLFFFLLTSCAAAPTALPTAMPSMTASPTPSITATLSPTATPTPSPTPTVVGIQWSKDAPVTACLPIQQGLPAGLHLPWLIFGDGDGRHVLDPNNGMVDQPSAPVEQKGFEYASSPSGKWLAYIMCNDENCSDIRLIIDPTSDILTKSTKGRIIWNPAYNFFLDGWLSNDRLMFLVDADKFPNILESTLVLNPFTGERHQFFLHEYPSALGSLLPDPTLTRLVFNGQDGEDSFHMVLWDIKNRKTLALLDMRVNDGYDNPPLWSPNGSDFVMWNFIGNGAEWFQITRDGDVHQLTYFSNNFKGVFFDRGRRSWDGHYLANRLYYQELGDDKYKYIYFVMDLQTQKPQGFCIGPGGGHGSNNINPLWSPDNRYMVFSDSDAYNWFLVDVEKQAVYQINHNPEFLPDAMIPIEGLPPTPRP